jgi:Holliday junction resolvase RusA-like endonuclease
MGYWYLRGCNRLLCPWIHFVIPKAETTLSFVIKGQPVVKKNTGKVVNSNGRIFKLDSAPYTRWKNSAVYQIAQQLGRPDPIFEPINLCVRFYMETRRATDLSNLLEGIQDVLVKCQIIADDDYKIVASLDGTRASYDKNNPRMEVEITPFKG